MAAKKPAAKKKAPAEKAPAKTAEEPEVAAVERAPQNPPSVEAAMKVGKVPQVLGRPPVDTGKAERDAYAALEKAKATGDDETVEKAKAALSAVVQS